MAKSWTFTLTVRFLSSKNASFCLLSRRKRFFCFIALASSSVLVKPTLLFGRCNSSWSGHFEITASKIYFYIYTITVIPNCIPKKVAYLKKRAGTLVFQPHYTIHSCGALCTYRLYDKQVNGAGAWWTERFINPWSSTTLNPLNRKNGTLQIGGNCFALDYNNYLYFLGFLYKELFILFENILAYFR